MVNKLIRFVHFFLLISLIVCIPLNYGQNTIVQARTIDSVKKESINLFPSITSSKIAFTSDRSGNDEIYVMNADGSNVQRITINIAADKQPSWSPDGSRIAFVSNRDGADGIYVMDSDGTNILRLTNSSGDWFPEWSPDGNQMAFYSGRDNHAEVYVMNSNGTGQTRLTFNSCMMPTWSPDGAKMACVSMGSNPGIYVMNANGTNPVRISTTGSLPSWSPDGAKIAYVKNEDIFCMDADGSHQVQLTNTFGEDTSPKWSPDGTFIIFTSWRNNNYEIYTMNADGSNQNRMTSNPAKDADPDWVSSNLVEMNVATLEATAVSISSACLNGELVDLAGETVVNVSFKWGAQPGIYVNETILNEKDVPGVFSFVVSDLSWGTTYYYVAKAVGMNTMYGQEKSFKTPFPNSISGKIVFVSNRDGIDEIYAMNTDGSNQVRLTGTEAANCGPVLSPDGSRIIFYSFRNGIYPEIYVMNSDGTNQLRITNNSAYDVYPTWTPDGTKMAEIIFIL
jgi:Tol biopolymer transport system component